MLDVRTIKFSNDKLKGQTKQTRLRHGSCTHRDDSQSYSLTLSGSFAEIKVVFLVRIFNTKKMRHMPYFENLDSFPHCQNLLILLWNNLN